MNKSNQLWEYFINNRIPKPMTFDDCTGKKRWFNIKGHHSEELNLYSLFASEIVQNDSENQYIFRSYSYASPQDAMNKLTIKIRNELSKKYLQADNSNLLNCTAYGRVSSGGVVIDGVFISWEEFSNIMQTHEGWEFKINFLDE